MNKKRTPQQTWDVEHDGRTAKIYGYLNGAEYTAKCPGLNLQVSGSDVAEVRQQIEDAARLQLAAVWEPFIEIRAHGYRSADSKGRHVEMQYKHIAVCKLRADAPAPEHFDTSTPDHIGWYMHRAVTERGDIDMMNDGIRHGLPRNLIRDTPEARKGLAEITAAMEDLEQRLYKLLHQGDVQAQLAGIASGKTPLLEFHSARTALSHEEEP